MSTQQTPWDRLLLKDRDRANKWEAESAKAKAAMRFAYVKISERKFMVIEYDGAGYRGNFDELDGRWDHRFRIVKTRLTYDEVLKIVDDLTSGRTHPADYMEEES